MDNVDVRRSENHEITDAECVTEKEEERQALLDSVTKSEHMKSKSSLSSISSDFSSEDDFFQLDAAKLGKPISSKRNSLSAGLLKVLDATEPACAAGVGSQVASGVDSRGDVAAGDGNPPSEAEGGDPDSSSPLGVGQTPLGQEAEKIEGYDPNRIPASVFTAKPLIPTEWSIASNESLFSLQMESYSFSREHGLLMAQSGELGSLSCSPSEMDAAGSPLSLSLDPEEVDMDAERDDQVAAAEAVNAQTMIGVLRAAKGEHNDIDSPGRDTSCSASIPRPSDASSGHSFTFPILAGASVSLRVVPEQQSQWQKHSEVEEMVTPRGISKPTPQNKWYQCFSCSLCHAD